MGELRRQEGEKIMIDILKLVWENNTTVIEELKNQEIFKNLSPYEKNKIDIREELWIDYINYWFDEEWDEYYKVTEEIREEYSYMSDIAISLIVEQLREQARLNVYINSVIRQCVSKEKYQEFLETFECCSTEEIEADGVMYG